MHNYVQLYKMNLFYLMLILQGLCILSYRKFSTEWQMVQHNVCQLINLNVIACYVFLECISIYFSQMPELTFEVEEQLCQTSYPYVLFRCADRTCGLEEKEH